MTGRVILRGIFFAASILAVCARPVSAVEYTGQMYRDPFGVASESNTNEADNTKKDELVLEGVIWNAVKPQALINGNIVKVGETVGDAKVLEIRKDGVKVRDQEKEYYLRFRRGAS